MKVKNCVHVNTSHISVMPRNQPTQSQAVGASVGLSVGPFVGQSLSPSVTQCLVFCPCSASDYDYDSGSDSESDSGLFCLRNAFLTFYWLKRQHWSKHTQCQWQWQCQRKCQYLTSFFISYISNIFYGFLFFEHRVGCVNIGLLFKYKLARRPSHCMEYMIEYDSRMTDGFCLCPCLPSSSIVSFVVFGCPSVLLSRAPVSNLRSLGLVE